MVRIGLLGRDRGYRGYRRNYRRSHVVLTEEKLGYKMKDGRIVGQFDDAVVSRQPPLLQSLPAGMAPKKKSTD